MIFLKPVSIKEAKNLLCPLLWVKLSVVTHYIEQSLASSCAYAGTDVGWNIPHTQTHSSGPAGPRARHGSGFVCHVALAVIQLPLCPGASPELNTTQVCHPGLGLVAIKTVRECHTSFLSSKDLVFIKTVLVVVQSCQGRGYPFQMGCFQEAHLTMLSLCGLTNTRNSTSVNITFPKLVKFIVLSYLEYILG